MLMQTLIGAALILTTVVVHAFSLEFIMKAFYAFNPQVETRWRAATSAFVVVAVFVAHVIEIWVWALFYYSTSSINELPTLEAALYFSTSAFTTVGFGDLVLSEEWRLLSSFESVNGMILFGWSTAFIFEVVRQIYSQVYRSAAAHSLR